MRVLKTLGFITHHEFNHIKSNDLSDSDDELKTDLAAYGDYRAAWDHLMATGDDSWFDLIFETPEGLVFTDYKQPDNQTQSF